MKRSILVFASLTLLLLNGRTPAQEPGYAEDLRFVQELRQRGDTDLAIDLLNRLAKTASPQLRNELPFEMALCAKAEAVNEPDSAKRLKLYAQARAELIKFRDNNPNHPRLADTKIDIADITVQEGKTQMSRAMALETVEAQSNAMLDARTKFEAASGELKAISDELDAKLDALKEPKTAAEKTAKAKLEKTRIRAELSVALNLFDIAQTFHGKHSKTEVLIERGNRMGAAVKALEKVAGNEDTFSEVWQARAWLGRCEHELGKLPTALDRFEPIIKARGPVATDGVRLARFFRMLVIQEQLSSNQAGKGESVLTLIDSGRLWIRDYPRALSTPEGYGVRFVLAESLIQASGGEKTPAAQKKEYRDEARKLTSALSETENVYTDRARYMKIALIGQEGGFSKDVAQLKTFDECYVRAQYEIMEISEDAKKSKDPKELEGKQQARVKTLLAALERGLSLPEAKAKGGNDVNNAKAMQAFYSLAGRKYADAIRYGTTFAKEDARASQAALAAAYALQAFGASIEERETNLQKATSFTDDKGQKISAEEYGKLLEAERADMLVFAAFCEKTWAKELAGNLARHQIGLMNLRNKKIAEGIKVLNLVTPEYPSYASIQNLIAETCLAADVEKVEPFADSSRGEKAPVPFRERGLAALRGIAEPAAGAPPEQVRPYFQAKSRLGLELYRDKKFAEMESLAAPLLPKVATTTFHTDPKINGDIREHFKSQLNKVRMFARAGQADAAFKSNNFKSVAELIDPVLKDLKTDAIAPAKNDPTLAQLLQSLLSMALQANIQLGDLDKVQLIVEVYGKAVGENPADAGVPEILRRLVPITHNQIRELKAKNDPNLDKVKQAFATILENIKKQTKMPTPEFLLVLAQCYSSLDKTDEAIKLLETIPKPNPADVEGLKIYQASRLTYLRQLRQLAANDPKQKPEIFKKCTALLNEWMGTKEQPGWASKIIDAHKERLYLCDMDDDTGGGFNKAQALVKVLSTKITDPNDQTAKNHYLECYYYMVYFLYTNAKKTGKAGAPDPQKTDVAASRIVELEQQYKDFGNDEMKAKFNGLMNAEKPLKDAYERLKVKK